MRRIALPAGLMAGITLAIMAWCFYEGILQCNNPPSHSFPVRGVDVSHHQGTIDWPVIAGQGIRFAYMKATEGGLRDTAEGNALSI